MKDERSGAERCWIWRDSYHYPRVSFAKPDRIHPSVEYVLAPQPAADTIAKPQGSLASNLRSLAPLFARLREDGGRYLLSVGLTPDEIAAAEKPTFGGKPMRRWLTDEEYAALCSLGSRDETTTECPGHYKVAARNVCTMFPHCLCSPEARAAEAAEDARSRVKTSGNVTESHIEKQEPLT